MTTEERSYREVFPTILAHRVEGLKRGITELQYDRDRDHFDFSLSMLSSHFKLVGIGELIVNSDPQKAKQHFYFAGKIIEYLFNQYNDGSVPVHASFITMHNYKTLLLALLSDCDELIDSLAHLIGGRPEEEAEHGHPFADNVGYAMKYILLHDYTKAQHHVNQLKQILDDPELEFVQGYAPVLQGILLSDSKLVSDGLALQLNLHKQDPEHEDQPEEIFSLQVLGLAKLAIRQGIHVTLDVDDPIAPRIMLQNHQIQYPSLDFLPSV